MPRTPRKQQWTDEACYHVMNCGHNREQIFGDDDDRRQFLRLLVRYQERYALRLYHYCLMGLWGHPHSPGPETGWSLPLPHACGSRLGAKLRG
jgi:hypothetical protein